MKRYILIAVLLMAVVVPSAVAAIGSETRVRVGGSGEGVDKSLVLRKVAGDPDRVRVTVINRLGERESISLLWGDLNGAIAVMGHDPAQG